LTNWNPFSFGLRRKKIGTHVVGIPNCLQSCILHLDFSRFSPLTDAVTMFITVRASFDRFNLADSTISWMFDAITLSTVDIDFLKIRTVGDSGDLENKIIIWPDLRIQHCYSRKWIICPEVGENIIFGPLMQSRYQPLI
jgi:hypothetical protein